MRTSQDWFNLLCRPKGTILLDPDGWDRKNFAYSWGEELITKDEFWNRLCDSTCQLDLFKWKFDWKGGDEP